MVLYFSPLFEQSNFLLCNTFNVSESFNMKIQSFPCQQINYNYYDADVK